MTGIGDVKRYLYMYGNILKISTANDIKVNGNVVTLTLYETINQIKSHYRRQIQINPAPRKGGSMHQQKVSIQVSLRYPRRMKRAETFSFFH